MTRKSGCLDLESASLEAACRTEMLVRGRDAGSTEQLKAMQQRLSGDIKVAPKADQQSLIRAARARNPQAYDAFLMEAKARRALKPGQNAHRRG